MPRRPHLAKPEKDAGAPKQGRERSTSFQQVQAQLKLADLIIEVVDARAPISSRHPASVKLFGKKPRIVVLAKEDLADSIGNEPLRRGMDSSPNQKSLSLSFKSQKGKGKLLDMALMLTKAEREKLIRKGMLPRPVRICVVGMPNVGKSTLINWFVGSRRVRVGDLPGITKGPQWVRINPQIELLDTPGVLPPTQFTSAVFLKLALLHLISPGSYETETVARAGLRLLSKTYPERIRNLFGIVNDATANDDVVSLETFGRRRNFLKAGGLVDVVRAANVFLNELRSGKLGRISLDGPDSSHGSEEQTAFLDR
jgi:ribosome biogenesis GTPase A